MMDRIVLKDAPRVDVCLTAESLVWNDGRFHQTHHVAYRDLEAVVLEHPWFPRFALWLRSITCLLNGVPYFPEPDAYPKAMLTLRFKGKQLRLRLSNGKMADASRRLKAALDRRVEVV